MKDLLRGLRNQINTIDEELVYLLYRRFEIVREIGTIKKSEWLDIVDTTRKNELLEIMIEEAKDKWVDIELITQMHELIHDHACKLEK